MSSDEKGERKNRIIKQLRNKFRLVIMNDDTFEEKASFVLSPLNVLVLVGSVILLFIFLTTYLIAFTSLKEYIPGYADGNIRRNLAILTLRADSMANDIKTKDIYLRNLEGIIQGKTLEEVESEAKDSTRNYHNLNVSPSHEDSLLREDIESNEKYSLIQQEQKNLKSGAKSFFFFSPIKGVITNSFRSTPEHLGIDIVAPKNEAIKATLDGTIMFATWTSETGYVIQVQHSNDLISVYKHNSVLLKKVGNRVKAGEAIAIIGDSGELTSGPHLHFELWYQGSPINPTEYMNF